MARLIIALFFGALLSSAALARNRHYKNGEEGRKVQISVPSINAISNGRTVDLASLIRLKNPPMTREHKKAIEDKLWDGSVKAKDASGNEIMLQEGDMTTISGYDCRARCQPDGDFHIEIGAGKTRRSKSIIVDVPDPKGIQDTQLPALVSGACAAPAQMNKSVYQSRPKKEPIKATVTGQLFLDATHHQETDPSRGRGALLFRGRHCAANLWEIHPVVRIEQPDSPARQRPAL